MSTLSLQYSQLPLTPPPLILLSSRQYHISAMCQPLLLVKKFYSQIPFLFKNRVHHPLYYQLSSSFSHFKPFHRLFLAHCVGLALSISLTQCPLTGTSPTRVATAELSPGLPVQTLPLSPLQPSPKCCLSPILFHSIYPLHWWSPPQSYSHIPSL